MVPSGSVSVLTGSSAADPSLRTVWLSPFWSSSVRAPSGWKTVAV